MTKTIIHRINIFDLLLLKIIMEKKTFYFQQRQRLSREFNKFGYISSGKAAEYILAESGNAK